MRYLFSRASRPVLTRLAQERTLCAFDFDGTLAPITEHPDQVKIRASTRRLLRGAAAEYPCVIISGRSRTDVLDKLGGVPVDRVVGNHGAEIRKPGVRARRQVVEWKTALERDLHTLPGVWIEDKGLSLAVHYRQSTQKAEARRRALETAGKLKRTRVFGGKQVVNLAMSGAPRKGDALDAERKRLRCDWVLFVGDDENDEDAFALEGNVIAVRVGRSRNSKAEYYLRSQAEIDRLLEALVSLRRTQ